ncbi:MAG: Ribosome-recycling factor [Candidatus Giovannonibacteria bacterium GW2011_GWA2_53_7]|uniref:Ribosome-recycling factor n=1 Tax=Candidatus Giovannonibacteria bacterium GW2011_GWA2_53_7 TaxID=1618650 RepID=A0A0G1Y227_9BACT|nr:MAG: Ribosome-recycling factor [Candidatus Giovannonibacteria bacterium GW2011_GWA2_53_7]
MHQLLSTRKEGFEKTLEHLRGELGGLRTGRAHPGLVEGVMVTAYGSTQPLRNVASVTVPDAQTLQIEPWDQSIVKDVERALTQADLGSNPNVDGKIIRLRMPQMNEETRKKMVKMMKEKLEDARVVMRQIREDVRHDVQKMEKDKTISEDERFKIFDELDQLTKEMVGEIDALGAQKEADIMTI